MLGNARIYFQLYKTTNTALNGSKTQCEMRVYQKGTTLLIACFKRSQKPYIQGLHMA